MNMRPDHSIHHIEQTYSFKATDQKIINYLYKFTAACSEANLAL